LYFILFDQIELILVHMVDTDKKINALKIEVENLKRKLFLSEQRYESLNHESQFGLAIEALSEGIVIEDRFNKIIAANEMAANILGLKVSQLLGKGFFDVRWQASHEDGSPFLLEDYPCVITNKTGKPVDNVVMDVLTSNNQRKLISINSSPIIKNNQITGVVAILLDVTKEKLTEKKLNESRQRFELAMKASKVGLFDWNLTTNDIYYSYGWKKMIGYEEHELTDAFSTWENLTKPEDALRTMSILDGLLNKKRDSFEVEFKMKHKKGHWVDILSRGEALFNKDGQPERVIGTHVDITDLKKTENKLKESEVKFYNAFENSPIPIAIINFKTGQRIDSNKEFSKTYGYTKPEYLKDSVLTHSLAVNVSQFKKGVKKIIKEGYLHAFPYTIYTQSGDIKHTLVDATQLYPNNKDIYITSLVDITPRKLVEDKLIESAAYAKTILNSLNASIAVIDEFGNILEVNDTWNEFSKINGITTKQMPFNYYNYFDACRKSETKEDSRHVMDGIKNVLDGKIEEFRHEFLCNTTHGEFWFLMRVIRMKGDKKQAVISHLNITEGKIAEKALKSSEEKFRNLAETVQASISIVDPNNNMKILFVNEYFQNVLGYTKQEAKNINALDLVHPEYQTELIERANKRLAGEILDEPYELKIITKSGESKWASFSAVKIIYEGKPAILTTAIDITERKLAELSLRKSEKENRTTLNELLVGVVVHASDTSILYSNEEASRILGLTVEQLTGRTAIDPNWGFVYTHLNEMALEDYPVNQVIATKKPIYNYTCGIARPDRNYITWANVNAIPILNGHNELEKVIVNFVDVTQNKLAEEQLKNTFKQLQLAIDTAQLGTWTLDIESGYLDWNAQQYEIYGITPNEFKNTMDSFRKRVHPEDLEYSDRRMSEIINGTSVFSVPFRIIRPNGEIRHIDASGTPIFDDLGNIVKLSGINRDITEQIKAENIIKNKDSEIFKAMIIAEEKERERYAKELHDGLGPILSTGMIYLHTMLDEENKKNQKEYLNRIYTLLEEATQSIREITNNLSPDIVKKFGVVQAVRSFVEKLKGVSDIKFSIHSNFSCRFPEIVEFTIYRAIIELLSNSLKHAFASKISINLKYSEKELNISVSDNGKGFDYNTIKDQQKGFGLMNVESRIRKLGGQYNFSSSPEKGTDVKIIIQTTSL